MSVSVYEYRDQPVDPIRTFLCDYRADINTLPTQTVFTDEYPHGTPSGSKAIVSADGSVWILNNAGEWVEM